MKNFTVYKSSAGSGKTFTLVKEYLRIALADPSEPNTLFKGILAITFTNKAAAEMKERVIKTLRKLSDKDTSEAMLPLLCAELSLNNEQLAARAKNLLNSILHNYSEFAIGTIDSFVHRIVRTFAIDLKLPLNFNIETNTNRILAQCVDELIRKVGEDKQLTSVLLEFSKSRAEENKNWDPEKEIISFVSKALNDEGMAKAEKLRDLSFSDLISLKDSLQKEIFGFENTLSLKGASVVSFIENNGYTQADFYQGAKGIYNYFRKIAEKNFAAEILNSYVRTTVSEDKWKSGKSNLSAEFIEELKTKFAEIENLREKGAQKYYTAKALFKNIYSLIVLSEIEKLLVEIKQEENIVFISEFSSKISEIVREEPVPFIYERLGEKYKHFLIDEFQDTSVMQWLNLLPLVDNSLAGGNFNLVVGDGKQSIYRWRGSEVQQFAGLPAVLGEKNQAVVEREQSLARNFENKLLEYNYRSRQNIVTFNNALFEWASENILSIQSREIYKDQSQKYKEKYEGGYVSFDVCSSNEEYKDEFVCAKALEYIRKNVDLFGYNYSDITVLVRKKAEGKKIADYLVAGNVPIVSSETLLVASNAAVRCLVSFLKLVSEQRNPLQEASALRYLATQGYFETGLFSQLWDEFYGSGKIFGEWLFTRKIADIRRHTLNGLPLFEMCCSIVRQLKLNQKEPLFIQFFLDEVLNYSKRNHENLRAFLDWWDEQSSAISAVLPAGSNAVNIMTIHTGKGLEFPVVIMPFTDWENNHPDSLWIDLDLDKDRKSEFGELKTALVARPSDLAQTPFAHVAEEEKQKQLLDNVNLLYVATTRAINHLHIISRNRNNSRFIDKWLIDFFYSHFQMQREDTFFETGEWIRIEKENATVSASKGAAVYLRDWKELVQVKFTADDFSDFTSVVQKRHAGILFHLAMSKIYEPGHETAAADWLAKNGQCKELEAEALQNKISSLFKKNEFSVFFQKKYASLNEPEIMSADGKTSRPDRIVFFDDHVAIIDYKTGIEKDDYEEQLARYQSIVGALGHTKVKKYIVYIEEERVEELA